MTQKGLTLIELMLVVALMLVLGAMSSVFYSRLLVSNSVSSASDQVAGQLRKAQTYAMAGRQNTSWGIRYSSNVITLFATGNSAFDESFTINPNVSITGFTSLTFAKITGLPDSAPTITISGNSMTKTISINSQGVVSR